MMHSCPSCGLLGWRRITRDLRLRRRRTALLEAEHVAWAASLKITTLDNT